MKILTLFGGMKKPTENISYILQKKREKSGMLISLKSFKTPALLEDI